MPLAPMRPTLRTAFFFTEVVDMDSTSATASGALARGPRLIRTPVSVLVIGGIEVALGVLTIGLLLESQAFRSDGGLDYVAGFAYASSAVLAATLVLLGVALCSSVRTRLRRVFLAHSAFAVVAAATAFGNLLAMQVHTWTTPITCDGCDASNLAPTVNQIAASVVLDLAAGAAAALLPVIAVLLVRNRRETAADGA